MTDTKHLFKKIAGQQGIKTNASAKWVRRASDILEGANPVQRRAIKDRSKFKGVRCPRRSGKSFYITSDALYTGEMFPGSRILIISLTLKSTKENFWSGSPGGLFKQNELYNLNLKFNNTDYTWTHENGSRGRLAGAETRADIEYFRGAAAEADIVFIDEGKSFAPDLFRELVFDVLMPGLMTRGGILVLCGTPGSIPEGIFYEATCEDARTFEFVKVTNEDGSEALVETKTPTCKIYEGEEIPVESGLWSLHTWTIKDNIAVPDQWKRALAIKKARKWDDENPVWRREYLGMWATDADELVYAYSKYKEDGRCNWTPNYALSKTGLDERQGPWNFVMGLDFGYEDDCAIVYAAWSEKVKELRVFYTWKSPHLTVDDFAEEINRTIDVYGQPSAIVGDAGALGKMIVETINQRHALGIIPAEKNQKFDHIELVNSDLAAGRIKILYDTDPASLHTELCGLQWLLDDDKKILIRKGKLREDPNCPNHLCDAFLYIARYSYHFYSTNTEATELEKGSASWWREKEREIIATLQNKSPDKQDYFSTKFKRYRDGHY